MVKHCSILLALVLSCLLSTPAVAQCSNYSITESVSSASGLSPCTEYVMTYSVTNTSTSVGGNTDIIINLPLGIQYLQAGTNQGATDNNTGPTTAPSFTISNWGANQTVQISFVAKTPCISNTSQSQTTGLQFTHVPSSSTFTCQAPSALTINNPSLIIYPQNNNVLQANTGDLVDMVYLLYNGSNIASIPELKIDITPDITANFFDYCITTLNGPCTWVSSLPAAGGTITIDAPEFLALSNNNDNVMSPQETFELHLRYRVKGCDPNNAPAGTNRFYWGCFNTDCQTTTLPAEIAVQPGVPNLVASLVPASQIINSGYCSSNQPAVLGFRYTNIAPLAALPGGNKLVDLVIYLYSDNTLAVPDPYSLRINSVPLSGWLANNPAFLTQLANQGNNVIWKLDFAQLKTSTNPPSFGSGTLADLDLDGEVDDLEEQDFFDITLEVDYVNGSTNCPAVFSTANNFVSLSALNTQERYKDQCRVPNNSLSQLPAFSVTNSPSASYTYNTNGLQSTMTLPPDVVEGTGFTAGFCPQFSQTFSSPAFNFNCTNPNYQIKVLLPPGYHLATSCVPLTLTYSYAISCGSGSMTYQTQACEVTSVNGNYVLINLGPMDDVVCTANVTYGNISCFDLPLVLNCSDPGVILDGETADNFSYTLEYVCDPGCTSCVDVLTGASASTYHHCIGSCATNYFHTSNTFEFERTTFGFANAPTNDHQNCTDNITPVSPTSNIRIDAAYPGDQIRATVQGQFSGTGANYSSMYLQLRHDILPAGMAHDPDEIFVFDAANSTITITNAIPSSLSGTYPVVMTTSTISGQAEMNFRLPSNITSQLLSCDFSAQIFLTPKTNPYLPANTGEKSFFAYGVHPMINLRAEYMGDAITPPNTIHGSCDHWGANFTIFQPQVNFSIYPGNSFSTQTNCSLYPVSFNFTTRGAKWGSGQQDFPNEFKPYAALDDHFEVSIPAGYNLVNSEFIISLETFSQNAATNNFSVPSSTTSYTFALTPSGSSMPTSTHTLYTFDGTNSLDPVSGLPVNCWPFMEPNTGGGVDAGYSIKLWLQPDCDAPLTSTITATGGWREAIQSPVHVQSFTIPAGNFSSTVPLQHVPPALVVNAPPIVNALTNQVTFNFTYCSTNGSAAPNPWIAFESPNNAFMASTLVQGSNTYSLTPYVNGNTTGWLANVGNIPAGQCITFQLTGTVSSNGCVTGTTPVSDFINVLFGYNCSPSSPQLANPLNAECSSGQTLFSYIRNPGTLNLNPTSYPGPSSTCNGTLAYSFTIENPQVGTIDNPQFWMQLPAGATLDHIDLTYLSNLWTVNASSPNYIQIGTGMGFNLETVIGNMPSTGLAGSSPSSPLANQVFVTVYLDIDCQYDPNSSIGFYAGGISPCSESLETSVQHAPVFTNANVADDLSLLLTADDMQLGCNESGQVTLTVTNNGSATVHSNTLQLLVPNTAAYNSITPSPSSTYSNANGTVLSWTLPPMNAGDVQTFVFGISSVDDEYCGPLRLSALYGYNEENPCLGNCPAISFSSDPVYLEIDACCKDTVIYCEGDTVNYEVVMPALGKGTAVCDYSWSPPTGLSCTNCPSPVITPPPGTTTYTLTISICETDGVKYYGVVATDVQYFTFTVNPAPDMQVSATDTVICNNSNTAVTLTASGASSYQWSTGATTASITVSPTVTTTYYVTGTDSLGCTDTDTITVHVIDCCKDFDISVDAVLDTVCEGSSAVLTASGAPYFYWSTGQTTASITVTPNGTTTYYVTGYDDNGCKDTDTITVYVKKCCEKFDVSVTATTDTICEGGSSTLTAFGATGYQWSTGQTTSSITVSPATTTTYYVTGWDESGCKDSASITIYVIDCCPCDNSASFTYTKAKCKATFSGTAMTSICSNIISWSWNFGDNSTSSQQNPVHVYSTGGVYNVCLTVGATNGVDTCYSTICYPVTIMCFTPGPVCNVNANFSSQSSQFSQTVNFTDLSTGQFGTNVTGWSWNFGDNTTSNVQNPSHTYAANGFYNVCLTVTGTNNGNTCTSTICKKVKVGKIIWVPNGPLGVAEPRLVGNYPNPFSDRTTIEYDLDSEPSGTIEVRDMYGKLLAAYPVTNTAKAIEIDALGYSPGVYYYSLVVKQVTIDTKRMVITR